MEKLFVIFHAYACLFVMRIYKDKKNRCINVWKGLYEEERRESVKDVPKIDVWKDVFSE